MLEKLLKARLLDYIAMDIKAPWRKYPAVVKSRVDLEDIRKSFKLIIKSQIPHEMRTTVVPKIHKEKDVIEIAKQIREARIYFLQQFRPIKTLDPKFLSYSPIPYEKLREWAKKCSRYIPTRVR
jgi:pyruvate formate lyase activating enzyme